LLPFSIDKAEFRGYIEVQQGSLKLEIDSSGLYVAVSSPKKPIQVI